MGGSGTPAMPEVPSLGSLSAFSLEVPSSHPVEHRLRMPPSVTSGPLRPPSPGPLSSQPSSHIRGLHLHPSLPTEARRPQVLNPHTSMKRTPQMCKVEPGSPRSEALGGHGQARAWCKRAHYLPEGRVGCTVQSPGVW